MKASERLLRRLRDLVDLPEGATLRRVYASQADRRIGAWSWCAVGPNGEDLKVGSQWPMAVLLRAEKLVASTPDQVDRDISIDPAYPARQEDSCDSR